MNKKIVILVAALLAIAAALAFYFLYFIKTPEYAVNEIRESVQQHDVGKFQKHVDLDSIYSKCFDDILTFEGKTSSFNITSDPLAIGAMNFIKPAVVELAKQETLNSISKVNSSKNKDQNELSGDATIADAMKLNFQRKAHFKSLKVKDIKLAKTSKTTADVSLVINNTDLDKDYALLLKMLYNDENVWQVKEISNLVPTLVKMEAAYRAKRAAQNQPVQERLRRALTFEKLHLEKVMEKPTAEEATNTGAKADQDYPHAVATLTITNNTQRTVNRIYYDIIVYTKDGHKRIYSHSEHFNDTIAPGKMVQVVNRKMLNTLIAADDLVNKTDFSKLDWEIRTSYIAFEDGHVISPNQFVIE